MEIIIKRETDSFYTFLSFMIMVAAVVLLVLLYNFAGYIVFVPTPFILFAAGIVSRLVYINYNKVEFEYSLHSGIFNIDKLVNQAKRQPVIKLPASDILTFGRYNDSVVDKYKDGTKHVDCSSGRDDVDLYYFTCHQNQGRFLIIFEPNEKLLAMLKGYSSVVAKALLKDNK